MPLRMYDPEGDREKASVKDKKKKSKLKGDVESSTAAPNKMLTGGQAKLDKNKNNRIDAQDFKILRKEKAKGRGQGLQDEAMKPGKPMKAALGALALGAAGVLGAKKILGKKKSATAMPAKMPVGDLVEEKKKQLTGKKKGGMFKGYSKVFKTAAKAGQKNTGTSTIVGVQPKLPEASKKSKIARRALKAAQATRVGKMLLPVAAAGVAAQQYLKSKMKKNKDGTPKKKMGGGMMQRPMGYKKGSPENPMKEERFQRTRQAAIAKVIGKENVGDPRKVERPSKKAEGGEAARSPAAQQRKMGQRKKKAGLLGGVGRVAGRAAGRRAGIPSLPGKAKKKKQMFVILGDNKKYSGGQGGIERDANDNPYRYSYDADPFLKDKTIVRVSNKSVGGSVTVKTKLGRNKPTKMY